MKKPPESAPSPAEPSEADAPAPEVLAPEELAQLRARAAEADAIDERFKRAQAEFVNESRRIQRQADSDRRFALEGLFKDLMQIVSSLDQALAAPDADAVPPAEPSAALEALRTGVALVGQQVEDLLKRHGAEVLRPAGEPFDPVHHEAIAMVEHAELPPGTVAVVLSPGLKVHGRVSKAAQVLVTRAPPAAPRESETGDA